MRTLLLSFLLVITVTTSAYAGSSDGAKSFIQKVGDKTLEVVARKDLNDKQKEAELARLFLQAVDTERMGRFVLGKYWRVATPEQKKAYSELYRKFLVGSYVPRFRDYTDQTFSIDGARAEDKEFVVQTSIINRNEPAVKVDYRLYHTGSKYLIVDIVAEGVSLTTTQRSEFGSFISQQGLDAFLKQLESRIAHIAETKAYMIDAAG
jgi:phospholipid transport system substrate-binding protein